jgi:hypothetical protein
MMAKGIPQTDQNCGNNASIISYSLVRLAKGKRRGFNRTKKESTHRSSHANEPYCLARIGVFNCIVIRERIRGLKVFIVVNINLVVAEAVLVKEFGGHRDGKVIVG